MIMAALQKFKLLAIHCAIMGSPTRSPAASPVINIRRRRTLRMLLSRSMSGGRRLHRREKSLPDRRRSEKDNGEEMVVRQKLKDLFLSSPPSFDEKLAANVREGIGFSAGEGFSDGGFGSKRNGERSLRPMTATFRQRLLRRSWRPLLVTIPE